MNRVDLIVVNNKASDNITSALPSNSQSRTMRDEPLLLSWASCLAGLTNTWIFKRYCVGLSQLHCADEHQYFQHVVSTQKVLSARGPPRASPHDHLLPF